MFLSKLAAFSLASLLAGHAAASDLPAIEIKGSKFFFSNNGSQFYMRGVAYQADSANTTSGSTFVDPLGDYDTCSRDIPYLQSLDTNVIRVYALNTSLDHTDCMQALNDAGIYVIADLSEPSYSINRNSPEWNLDLYDRYTSVIDAFQNYTNILGFFAGNEVSNQYNNTDASAFVKAAIRDSKQYISDQGYRSIPVGYSSNDDAKTRVTMANYFACGDEDVRADFYGINMYEWCGESTFEDSGYADRTEEFSNMTIPVFFSEYGCNEVTPRKFTEVQAIYGENMTDVWSGGIVYMYFEETNNYGLVSIDSNSDVKTLSDYSYYSKEINSISPTSVTEDSYTPTSTYMSCPTEYSYWLAATDLPPTPDEDLCECMAASLSCVVDDSVSSDDYSTLYSYICGEVSCDGVTGNGTTGEYGAYSFCSDKDKLSFVMNLYYLDQDSDSSACDFDGSASLASSATTASACSAALKAIGTAGTGTYSGNVTYATSGSSASTTSGSSTSGTSSSSSSTSTKSSGAIVSTKVSTSHVFATVFVTLFAIAGAGLVMV